MNLLRHIARITLIIVLLFLIASIAFGFLIPPM